MEVAGARITTIIGSISIFLGMLLSAFAPNVYMLYVTFGLIAGEYSKTLIVSFPERIIFH